MAANRSRAPEFSAGLEWFNVDRPVRLADQAGRIVLLVFGASSSIYCQRVLQDLKVLGRKYRDDLVIISVNTPRYAAERKRSHVLKVINKHQINHALVHDPEKQLWNLYGVRAWPTQVLVDREGLVLGSMSGDGKLAQLDLVIRNQINKNTCINSLAPAPVTRHRTREVPAPLSFPGRIITANDRLYVSDSGHNRILVLSLRGDVLRQYGGEVAGFIDGNGTNAAFHNPQGMTLAGDFLYIADERNHAIRRIHIVTGDVDTIAGTGKVGIPLLDRYDVPVDVSLNSPSDVVFKDGKLYIAMSGLHQIWCLSLVTNTLKLFSGSGKEGLLDGPATTAAFAQPSGLALLFNRLYSIDAGASAVREVDVETGAVRTIVGEGLFDYGDGDGTGKMARLQYPLDIHADPEHRMLWIADTYNNKIKRIGVNSEFVSSVVVDRRLEQPGGLAFHDDTLYIANTNAHEIVCLNPNNGHAEALNVSDQLVEI
jgi:thioredoxin-related protein